MNINICTRNSFQEENLMKILAWMELCGDVGHYTEFTVCFDGDGDAAIYCDFETEELREKYKVFQKELYDNYDNGQDPEYFSFD